MDHTGHQRLHFQHRSLSRTNIRTSIDATAFYRRMTLFFCSALFLSNTAPASADQMLAKQIYIFDNYCRAYYTNLECEGALRHILADRGPQYLMVIGYVEDPEPFFDNLREVIEFGKIYQPRIENPRFN